LAHTVLCLSIFTHHDMYYLQTHNPQSTKWIFQEKSKKSVGALEWRGDDIFCGFEHGRVIRRRLNVYDGTMASVAFPENFGSQVIQLSSKGNSLLVGTVERTWIMNIDTHKLEQVRCSLLYCTCIYIVHMTLEFTCSCWCLYSSCLLFNYN